LNGEPSRIAAVKSGCVKSIFGQLEGIKILVCMGWARLVDGPFRRDDKYIKVPWT